MPHLPQTLRFDFDRESDPIPFAPGSHTSYLAARGIAASPKVLGRKTRAWWQALFRAGTAGLSDYEVADAIAAALRLPRGLPVQSICPIRNHYKDFVERADIVIGPWGRKVQRWRLNAAGLAAAKELVG